MKKLLTLLFITLCSNAIAQEVQNTESLNGTVVIGDAIEQTDVDVTTQPTDAPTDNQPVIKDRSARKGYRGYVNVTPTCVTLRGLFAEVSTTHGKQFNPYLFVGGGVGVMLDYRSNSGEYDYAQFMIPVYVALKGNVGRRMAQFTYGIRAGWAWGKAYLSDLDDNGAPNETYDWCGGFYSNYSVGLRLAFTPQYALRITPEMSTYLGSYLNLTFGLRLGFEF